MSSRSRPRAPWHSPATRRLSLIRVGLPTLIVCVLATGPGAVAQAQRTVPPGAAALMNDLTNVLQPSPPKTQALGVRGQALMDDGPGRNGRQGR